MLEFNTSSMKKIKKTQGNECRTKEFLEKILKYIFIKAFINKIYLKFYLILKLILMYFM